MRPFYTLSNLKHQMLFSETSKNNYVLMVSTEQNLTQGTYEDLNISQLPVGVGGPCSTKDFKAIAVARVLADKFDQIFLARAYALVPNKLL